MNHSEIVEQWLGEGFAGLSGEQQIAALERSFNALWLRARGTLGDITLAAIGERVLAHAHERYPFLVDASLTADGLRCVDVRLPASSSAVLEGARYLMVELLTILGRLTAEILTPALHDELMRPRKSRAHDKPRKPSKPSKPSKPTKPSKTSKTSKSMSKSELKKKKRKKTSSRAENS